MESYLKSNRMDQIPSKDSMPGSLYSDLAKIYEKAAQFPDGGSITIIAVTTLSGGDITHAIPESILYREELAKLDKPSVISGTNGQKKKKSLLKSDKVGSSKTQK